MSTTMRFRWCYYRSRRRGMPSIHSPVDFCSCLFHSQPSNSKPSTTRKIQQLATGSLPTKITNLEDARKVFDEMLQRRPLPSVARVTQVLSNVAKMKHYSAVGRQEVGAKYVIFNILIQGLCQAGKIESARDMFCGLSSKGVPPNVRTYNILINELCTGGLISKAEMLLREMEQKACSPDGCTYNIIIREFIKNNQTSRAMRLIQQMKQKGFSADSSTFELIVNLLSRDEVDPVLFSLVSKSQ